MTLPQAEGERLLERKRQTRAAWAVALAIALAGSPVLAQQKGKPAKPPAGPVVNIDVPAARAELLGTDVDKAEAAALKLGASRQPGALDALLDALALGVSPRVAVATLAAVGKHANPAALDVLLHYARHRSGEVRAQAVLALGGLDERRA